MLEHSEEISNEALSPVAVSFLWIISTRNSIST